MKKKHRNKNSKKVIPQIQKRARKDDYQGSNGWYKINYHALWGLMPQMRKYGPVTNFHGGLGEEHHKDSMKKSGANIQKRPTSYTCQVSQRSGE